MNEILILIVWILCISGFILIILSSPTSIIVKKKYQAYIDANNKVFYSIQDMKKIIHLSHDVEIKRKLSQKIIIRKVGFYVLIMVPIMIIIGNLIK